MPATKMRFHNDQSADEYSEILEADSKRKRPCVDTLQNDVSPSPIELSQSQQTMLEDAISSNTFLFQPTYYVQFNYTPQVNFEVNNGDKEVESVSDVTYGESQFNILEDEFKKSQWLDFQRRRELASLLNLNEIQIEDWFANRRVKQIWLEQYGQFCSHHRESVVYSSLSGSSNDEYQMKREVLFDKKCPTFEDKYNKIQLPHFNDTFHESATKLPLINNSVPTWVDDQLNKQNRRVQCLQAKTVSPKCDSSLLSTKCRIRSRRTTFSKDQLIKLEQKFEECRYINYDAVSELALDLNLTNEQIRTWFKNKRTKHKKIKNIDQILQSPMKTAKPISSSVKSSKKKEQFSKTLTHYNQIQKTILKQAFEKCQYPEKDLLMQLAIETDSTEDRVRNWFKVRRRDEILKNKVVQSQTETSSSPTSTASNLMNTTEFYQTPITPILFNSSSTKWLDEQVNVENSLSTINQQAAAFLQNCEFQKYDGIINNSETIASNETFQSLFSPPSPVDYSPNVLLDQQSDIGSVLPKINHKEDICSQVCQCAEYNEVIEKSKENFQFPISRSENINYSPITWIAKESDFQNELLAADLGVTVHSPNWQYQKYDNMAPALPIQQYVVMTTLPSINKEDECCEIAQPTAKYVYAYDNNAAINKQVTLFEL